MKIIKSIFSVIVTKVLNLVSKIHSKTLYFLIFNRFSSAGKNIILEYPFRKVSGFEYIEVGSNVYLHSGLWLSVYKTAEFQDPRIRIGSNVCVNYNCQITAINSIDIADNVLIGSNVIIVDHSHGEITFNALQIPPIERPLVSKGPIEIGKNVWIGANAVILGGVTIGDNCIIGANSVVTKSFQKNTVIGGAPAGIIKYFKKPD